MSQRFTDLIEKRQVQLRQKDRQMRLLFLVLGLLAVVAIAVALLRPDPATAPVRINTASAAQLVTLPEVGPELAQRIIAARPIADETALLQVKGIGAKTLEKIRPRLVFDTP